MVSVIKTEVVYVCLLVASVGHALYRRCSLHDEALTPLCRLPQSVTFEMVSKHSSASKCSSFCELLNHQHSSYKHGLSPNFLSFVTRVAENYPHVKITVDKSDQREMIHAEYFDLYATLNHYPPVSRLASPYERCSGFNFISSSGRCQFFATSENAAFSSNDTPCSYYEVTLPEPD